jgi:hypothetical protein
LAEDLTGELWAHPAQKERRLQLRVRNARPEVAVEVDLCPPLEIEAEIVVLVAQVEEPPVPPRERRRDLGLWRRSRWWRWIGCGRRKWLGNLSVGYLGVEKKGGRNRE